MPKRGDANKIHSTIFEPLIPKDRQETKRKELLDNVRKLIKSKYRYSEVFVYGSYASGTALYWSDLDIGVKVKTQNAEQISFEIEDFIGANGFVDVRVLDITGAYAQFLIYTFYMSFNKKKSWHVIINLYIY